jgi:hypothetical protein
MPTHTKSTRGIGNCGNPYCTEPRKEGRWVCEFHAQEMDRIREEMETDPKLLYNQRSAKKDRLLQDGGNSGRKAPRRPTCCWIGCYELRVPPSPFCWEHEDQEAA